jgi:valyl-tRNA synthetase
MIMAGLEFMGDVPFSDVYFNGIVRDSQGRKMSKSLDSSIDPLDIVEEYGADALRFTMMICAQGQDIYISKDNFDIGRNFCNKIWNASRFLLTNIADNTGLDFNLDADKLSSDDIYILGKLNETIGTITDSLEKFRFNEAASRIYEFFWHQYCDKYIEYAKAYLVDGDGSDRDRTASVLVYVLTNSLKMMHPFLPYISEQIWSMLPGERDTCLAVAEWPEKLHIELCPKTIRNTESKYELITAGRNLRKEYNIPPKRKLKYIIRPLEDEAVCRYLETEADNLVRTLNAESVTVRKDFTPEKPMPSALTALGEVFLSIEGAIDIEAERERLQKELDKTREALARSRHKLRNPSFVEKAPEEVVEKAKGVTDELADKAQKLERTLEYLS